MVSLFDVRTIDSRLEGIEHVFVVANSLNGAYGHLLINLLYRLENFEKPTAVFVHGNEIVSDESVALGIFQPEDLGEKCGYVFVNRYGGVYDNVDIVYEPVRPPSLINVDRALGIFIGFELPKGQMRYIATTKSKGKALFVNYDSNLEASRHSVNVESNVQVAYLDETGVYMSPNFGVTSNKSADFQKVVERMKSRPLEYANNTFIASSMFNCINSFITDGSGLNYLMVNYNLEKGLVSKEYVSKQMNERRTISKLVTILELDEDEKEINHRVVQELLKGDSVAYDYSKFNKDLDLQAKLSEVVNFLLKVYEDINSKTDLSSHSLLKRLESDIEEMRLFLKVLTVFKGLVDEDNTMFQRFINSNDMVRLNVYTLILFVENRYGNMSRYLMGME